MMMRQPVWLGGPWPNPKPSAGCQSRVMPLRRSTYSRGNFPNEMFHSHFQIWTTNAEQARKDPCVRRIIVSLPPTLLSPSLLLTPHPLLPTPLLPE